MCLFVTQQVQQHSFDVFMAIWTLLIGMVSILIYCYLGKISTESYEEMSDCVYKMKWYVLPIELQKFFILMIANMEKSLQYHGFGVIDLNLETFTKVRESNLICDDLNFSVPKKILSKIFGIFFAASEVSDFLLHDN